ncbi:hypothetical protein CC86DRAFT_337424 [Ophiobolus disseminans]|uniref:Uncharacterized protein n=1 Tax=Ophiobolus disseminans TaxID=1469910 RepID=A0A6A6ZAV1_9PLEO|nr:hypothetical protein CC86DRAFT_337424 [Ophiobolus disseminans]
MPEAEQTKDGDLEYVEYHTWEAVDYDRHMSWEASPGGRVSVGVKTMKQQDTEDGKNEITLRSGFKVIVHNVTFKLKAAS